MGLPENLHGSSISSAAAHSQDILTLYLPLLNGFSTLLYAFPWVCQSLGSPHNT